MSELRKSIAKIQSELSGVGRDAKGYNYKYATLNNVIDALKPLLSEEGLGIDSSVKREGDQYSLITSVFKGDEERLYLCPLDGWQGTLSGKNNNMQAMGAAISYARRYNLLNAFNLYQEDDDAQSLTRKNGQVDLYGQIMACIQSKTENYQNKERLSEILSFIGVENSADIQKMSQSEKSTTLAKARSFK